MRGRTNINLKGSNGFNSGDDYTVQRTVLYPDSSSETDDGYYEISYTIPATAEAIMGMMAFGRDINAENGGIYVLANGVDITDNIVANLENTYDSYFYKNDDISSEKLAQFFEKVFYLRKQDLRNVGIYAQEFTLIFRYENYYSAKYVANSYIYLYKKIGSNEENEYNIVMSSKALTYSLDETSSNRSKYIYTIPATTEAIMFRVEALASVEINNHLICNVLINDSNKNISEYGFLQANKGDNFNVYPICLKNDTGYGYSMMVGYINKQELESFGIYGKEFTLTIENVNKDSYPIFDTSLYLFTKEEPEVVSPIYYLGSGISSVSSSTSSQINFYFFDKVKKIVMPKVVINIKASSSTYSVNTTLRLVYRIIDEDGNPASVLSYKNIFTASTKSTTSVKYSSTEIEIDCKDMFFGETSSGLLCSPYFEVYRDKYGGTNTSYVNLQFYTIS